MSYHNGGVEDLLDSHYTLPTDTNENPAYQSSSFTAKPSNWMEMQFPQNFENSDIITRTMQKPKSVKESSRGIENIIMEMPSRTIGRRAGHRIANAGTSSGAASLYNSYSRFTTNQLTHQDLDDDDYAAHQYYDEIAQSNNGDVSMNDIRSLPVNMTIKKQVRQLVHSDLDKKKSKALSGFRMWRYDVAIKYERATEGIRKRVHSPRLWNRSLKQVEGNFGSGVSSYFLFLRGLFFLSIPSFILNFAFISLPQLLDPPNRTYEVNFTGEELLTGANWLSETIMYYGYYTNGTIAVTDAVYQMPLAYLLATCGYFLLCLLWLSKATATSFRDNYIQGKVSFSNFIGKTFCAWDYGITSNSVAHLHQKIITTDLKEVLAERLRDKNSRPSDVICKIYLLRAFVWLMYFGLAGGSAALVYYLNFTLLDDINKPIQDIPVLKDIMLAVLVSAINLIMPIIINLATRYEKYSNPRHELYVAVLRNYLLKVGLLGVICAFWTDDDLLVLTGRNSTCWETRLGEEVYRLVIIDFLFSIIFATLCAEFIRKILSKYFCTNLERAEFSIVNNVMDLIYGQTLCWIGVFFSPLLSLIVIIKYFLMFYIKKFSVMQNCQASKKRWRAAQSRTMFNGLLLVSFLLSGLFFSLVVFRKVPSSDCGPYRDLNRTYDAVVIAFQDLLGDTDSAWFVTVINVIVNIWFLSGINTALLVFIVMRRSRSIGYARLGKALREQIALEGRDKVLLLQWLQQLTSESDPPKPDPKSGKPNHRVPILLQHHASNASSPAQQRHQSPHTQTVLTGNILTHVDIQHVGNPSMLASNEGQVKMRKKHLDPVLHRALANKEKQRPVSMFVLGDESLVASPRTKRNSYSGQIELELLDASYTEEVNDLSSDSSEPDTHVQSSFQGNVYM